MINANSTYNTADSTLIRADNYSISCYLVGSGNRNLNSPLNWSSTSGGTPADVLGSELLSGWNFTSGWSLSGGTIIDLNSFSSAGVGGIFKSGLLTIGKSYKCTISGVTTAGNLTVREATNNLIYSPVLSGTFNSTFYFIALQTSIYLRNSSAGQTDISSFTIQEVLSVPNSSNPAIIDANSSIANGDILSLSAQFDCGGFDCSAAAYTFTLSNAAYAFNVYGDLKDSTKRVNGFSSTGYLYFKGSSNIYSNGATQGWNRIYFDGVGATFTNQDDWNVGYSSYWPKNGTWTTNDKTIRTFGEIHIDTGTKTINLGASIIYVGIWTYTTNEGYTLNAGTSTIYCDTAFYGASKTYYDVILNGSASMILAGGSSFNTITRISGNSITADIKISGNISISNTFILTGNNASNYRLLVASNTIGTPRTITCNGSIVASNVDFRDITLAGTANRDLSAISGGSGDCGGNSGITFTPSQTQYYKHTSGACQWSDATKWVTSSGGSTQGRVPLPQDDPIFDQNSFTGASTLSVNCPRIGRSLNMEAVNQAVTFALANNVECYGSYVLGNNITPNLDYLLILIGRDNCIINTYSKTINNLKIDATGTFTLMSNLNCRELRHYLANLDFNDYNVNCLFLYSYVGGVLRLGDGIIYCRANGVYQNIFIGSNLFPEGSTIILNPAPAVNAIDVSLNGKSYNKVVFSGSHTGNFIISGNNTFNELVIEKGRKVQITGGSTQTIGKLIADGTPTEQITIGSTNTTPFNLVYAGTGFHQVNYCNISYCNATDNRFYAGKNSTDGGNNTGWKFRSYLTKYTTTIKRKLKLVN